MSYRIEKRTEFANGTAETKASSFTLFEAASNSYTKMAKNLQYEGLAEDATYASVILFKKINGEFVTVEMIDTAD